MWYSIVLIVAALAIIVLLNSFVFVRFIFVKEDNHETLLIDSKALFGVIRYRYKMPYFIFKGFEEGFLVKEEMMNQSGKEEVTQHYQHINKHTIQEAYEKAKQLITHVFGFSQWLTKTICRLKCTKLQWKTNIGTGDAAETAISIGLIWGLKSSLIAVALKYLCFDVKPMLAVNPQFNKAHFSTELLCIVKIRLGFVLLSGMLLIYRILKVKGGARTWKNILFKA